MIQLLYTWRAWLTRRLGWSNSRQSWEERLALVLLVAAAVGTAWLGARLSAGRQVALWAALLLIGTVLLRRGWLKLLGPVFFYDLIRTARRGRYFVNRTAYLGVLVFGLFWLYYIWSLRSQDQTIPRGEMANFAESFFLLFTAVQFVVVALITPTYVSGAISEEKEHRTLEYLLATDLRNREIVLGKLASRLANLVLLVLTGLPVLSLLQLIGGVDPDLLLALFALTGLTMLSQACLGILFSVYTKRSREAILLTYFAGFAYCALSAASLLLLTYPEVPNWEIVPGQEPYTFADLLLALNAGNPFVFVGRLVREIAAGVALRDSLADLLPGYAIFHGLVSLVATTWAVLRLRAVALKQAQALVVRRAHALRRWGRPPVGNQPMVWKEVFEPGLRFSWLGRAVTYAILITLLVPAGTVFFDLIFFDGRSWETTIDTWVRTTVVATASLTLLAVAVRASGAVSGERDRETFDALLTSPLSGVAILGSKWLGSILSMRWAWLALFLTWCAGAAGGKVQLWMFALVLAAWLVYAALAALLGLWFSLVSPTSQRATLRTLAAMLVLMAGHWLMWGYYMPYLLLSPDAAHAAERFVDLHVALTPPAVLGWLAFRLDEFPYREQMLFWDMACYVAVGLGLWLLGTLALAGLTLGRFRSLYGRGARPEVATPAPGAEEEAAVARLIRGPDRVRWRRRLAVAAVVAAPFLGLVLEYVFITLEADRTLRAAMEEAAADDPHWRFFDIENGRKEYAPEENAAAQAIAARRLMPRVWPSQPKLAGGGMPPPGQRRRPLDELVDAVATEQQLDLWVWAQLRAELAAVAKARDQARTLEHFAGGRIAVNWAPDLVSTLLPDLQEMRTVARLLQLDAYERVQAGDADGALASVRSMLGVARAIGDEPILISQLVRIAITALAANSLERVLAQGQPSPAALEKTQAAFEEEARFPVLLVAFRGERGAMNEMMQAIRQGKLRLSQVTGMAGGGGANPALDFLGVAAGKGAHTWLLRYFTQTVAVARLPAPQRGPELKRLENEVRQAPVIPRMLVPAWFKVAEAGQRHAALLGSAATALAAERYRRDHGRWPDRPEALVPRYLTTVPLDPFDGQPLRYRRTEQGLVIYSVGADGTDDGGKVDRKRTGTAGTDVGVRLWDPDRRRQPPRNPDVGPPYHEDNPW